MNCFEKALERTDLTATQREMVEMAKNLAELARAGMDEGIAAGVPAMIGIRVAKDASQFAGQRGVVIVEHVMSEEMRAFAPQALRRLLREAQADAYVLMVESWTLPKSAMEALARRAKEEGREFELDRPISEDDRRISVLSLHGESKAGEALAAVLRINEKDKRSLDLDNEEMFMIAGAGEAKGEGRLVGLLDEPQEKEVVPVVTRKMVQEAAEMTGMSEEEVEKATHARGITILDDCKDADALICMPEDGPSPFDDNVHTTCDECGTGIVHRPDAPATRRKLCIRCASAAARRETTA